MTHEYLRVHTTPKASSNGPTLSLEEGRGHSLPPLYRSAFCRRSWQSTSSGPTAQKRHDTRETPEQNMPGTASEERGGWDWDLAQSHFPPRNRRGLEVEKGHISEKPAARLGLQRRSRVQKPTQPSANTRAGRKRISLHTGLLLQKASYTHGGLPKAPKKQKRESQELKELRHEPPLIKHGSIGSTWPGAK